MAHSREIKYWKKTVRNSHWVADPALFSCVCRSALPLSWQCCLSLYTRGNCTTIKGNKAEKEAVCRLSGDSKKFPAAGAGRRVVKLLSIMASVLGSIAFLFYYSTKKKCSNESVCATELKYFFTFSVLLSSEHLLNNISLLVLLSYSVIPSFISLLSSPC